ncbi:MAG: Lysyl-tRNA synthetase (class II) [uncultured Gemmatimonadetes bacterium]|uniref:Lysine--tRNA ligase n=1 Tax=uncultured Gemmatimonadota bacterium TaxID=203437 RepID=A0A6J4LTM9_9BACT|nr:MAG: Lysyl-tRNA synthetase (class II) [uncultured Gemmatimonadota bacterium]
MSEGQGTPAPEAGDRIVAERMEKLHALREQGVEPFAYGYDPTHSAAGARGLFEAWEGDGGEGDGPAERVRLAGRVVAKRVMGKSTFIHLADRTGRIQLYLRVNDLADTYPLLDLVDLSDWIGAEGTLFRTRTGELSLRVTAFSVLAKAIRPLPLGKEEVDPETGERRVYSGFSDVEARYRQRYADLAVNPEVRDVFVLRSRVVSALRRFLDERGFLEVETPVLQPLYGGAAARPFTTHHNALDMRLYLRIAVELYLKRLIVGGMERVYEMGKNFRNEGLSRFHNPEFTMLEFYAAYMDYEGVMDLTEEMLGHVVSTVAGGTEVRFGEHTISFAPPFRRLTMYDALRELGGVDVEAMPDEELAARVRGLGIAAAEVAKLGRGKLIDELFGGVVEPRLIQPTFITDYPREMSPLAKPKRGNPELTERFELIVAGKELCNAYSELNDPIDQRGRFEAQERLLSAGDEEAQRIDEDFIRALEYGMPPTGGFGMGIDRLMMILSGEPSIRDVILFPTMRPE